MAKTSVRMRTEVRRRETRANLPGRTPTDADLEPLGELMLAAYFGTLDDEGEDLSASVQEARKMFRGGHGLLLRECSFVLDD